MRALAFVVFLAQAQADTSVPRPLSVERAWSQLVQARNLLHRLQQIGCVPRREVEQVEQEVALAERRYRRVSARAQGR